MTTKHKRTVLSIKVTICEHLDKGSSKSKITNEYNIGKLTISDIYKPSPSLTLLKWSLENQSSTKKQKTMSISYKIKYW